MVNALSISSIGAKPAYPGPGMWLHGGNRALMRRMLRAQHEREPVPPRLQPVRPLCPRPASREPGAVPPDDLDRRRARPDDTAQGQPRTRCQALKAQVHSVPSGHSLMAEAPDAVLAALRARCLRRTASMNTATSPTRRPRHQELRRVLPAVPERTPQPHLPPPALRRLDAGAVVPGDAAGHRASRSTCCTGCCAAMASPGSATSSSRRTSRPASSARCTASSATG